jgi:cytochrome c553
MAMLLATVKRSIPIGLCRAKATMMRRGIRFFSSSMFLTLAFNSTAAQRSSSPLAAPVKTVVNQYCVSCHDADVKKGGLDLERIIGDGFAEFAKVHDYKDERRRWRLSHVAFTRLASLVEKAERPDRRSGRHIRGEA